MIEEIVIKYLLSKNVAGGHVYAEVPERPPAAYVLIQRSAGSITNYLRTNGIYTEARSKNSQAEAAVLHEEVIAAMLAMPDTEAVFSCKLNADYYAAQTQAREYRYQALWSITQY